MHPALRRLALAAQRALGGFDPRAARAGEAGGLGRDARPIFLVGAPRSGSTLLFQLLVRHCEVAYLSNLMALAPVRMLRLASLTRAGMRKPRPVREDSLGYVPGLLAPNEGGTLMRAWFGAGLDADERRLVRASVAGLSEILGGPWVAKNLWNSLRLRHIRDVFPEAAFVHLRRDPRYAAQSLLRARAREHGDAARWLGPEPPGHEAVHGEPATYQVLWQVRALDAAVGEFLREGSVEHREVRYEDLCADAEGVLRDLASGLGLSWRPGIAVPPLSHRDSVRLPPEQWRELLDHHAALFG